MQPCRTPEDVRKLSDIATPSRTRDIVPVCRSSIRLRIIRDTPTPRRAFHSTCHYPIRLRSTTLSTARDYINVKKKMKILAFFRRFEPARAKPN